MSPDEMEKVIKATMPVLLHDLHSYGFSQHCIQAGALVTKVLHGLGMDKAYPLTVGVRLINQAFRRYTENHGFPEDDASRAACNRAGGAYVLLGKDAPDVPEGNWRGHLVVIVPCEPDTKHFMLDLTIPQANWPEFGIVVSPLVTRVTDHFVSGSRPAEFNAGKTLLIYDAYPEDHSYNDEGYIINDPSFEEAVSGIVRRVMQYEGDA